MTTQHTPTRWLICDCPVARTPCLYTAQTQPKSGRCIRHGAMLDFAGYSFDGKTREQVRAALAQVTP